MRSLRSTITLAASLAVVGGALVAQQAGAAHTKATVTTAVAPVVTVASQAAALLPRPALVSPISRSLTPASPGITLDSSRDYVITIPAGAVFTKPVTIMGGHNVVLENAVLQYSAPVGTTIRGLLLKAQTGIMYVNGLQIRGPLAEGIDLEQRAPGAAVVLRNIDIDLVDGTYATNHADLLQTWAGPDRLVVDGFSGSSDYQGMFLEPQDLWVDGPLPSFFSLSNVTMDVSTGYYALWTQSSGPFPIATNNVLVKPNPARPSRDSWLWPKPSTGDLTWSAVTAF